MEMNKLVRKAMLDKNITGKMELVDVSGVSYSDVTKIMSGDGSVKLIKVKELLNFLGYELKAEVSKCL
jgi:DNA-binding Xre family transcriptional regulator